MSTEHAYAYEAGYRDGSINYELEHCPACKNVADLQEALAENAKLRKENRAMSITDELRKEARDLRGYVYTEEQAEHLTAIADCIDAEHEAMLVDARKTVYPGYIELPKDADDVPWKVGDRDEDGNVVTELRLTYDGCWFVITDGEWPYRPKRKRHHHAPNVEDEHECYFKWSLADNGWVDHTCSKCGFVENTDIHVGLDWNYCPNCGRKVVSK